MREMPLEVELKNDRSREEVKKSQNKKYQKRGARITGKKIECELFK